MLPPEPRLPDARRLIDQWQYFIVPAPRQSGKTTTLETLAGNLNAEGRHDYSQGQPRLVNALANEIVAEMGIVPPVPITMEQVDPAKERLILARAPHFESLAARLNDPRVRRVIEPLIAGELPVVDGVYNDEVAYVRDLGLIAVDKPARVANPIYREVIVRILGAGLGEAIDVRRTTSSSRTGSLTSPRS
jgi:hypothetical protein